MIVISTLVIFLMVTTSFTMALHTNDIHVTLSSDHHGAVGLSQKQVHSYMVSSGFPSCITVADSSPFYPLIVTPVAVRFGETGEQQVIPLYIESGEEPSQAILRVRDQINRNQDELHIDDTASPEEVSLAIAQDYWSQSDAALLMTPDKTGYMLGAIATPLASYLGIPVIVTKAIDEEVRGVLETLGVTGLYICGDMPSSGYWVKRFHTAEEIVEETLDVIQHQFGDVSYITLTNPLDAWPPQTVASQQFEFGPVTLKSGATTRLYQAVTGGSQVIGAFTIPEDYKYALIKFEGVNLEID